MPNDIRATCPFYITHRIGKGKWDYTITCEDIQNNIGFEMRNQLRFVTYDEQRDYLDLFCGAEKYCDCPYYKLIYKKYESDPKDK